MTYPNCYLIRDLFVVYLNFRIVNFKRLGLVFFLFFTVFLLISELLYTENYNTLW